MKYLKAIIAVIGGLINVAAMAAIGFFLLAWIAGYAAVNCNYPSWLNHNYSCSATVIIPNR